MRFVLELGDGVTVPCRDAYHAQRLATLFAVLTSDDPAPAERERMRTLVARLALAGCAPPRGE